MKEQLTYDQAIKLFDIQRESILEITRLNAKAINAKTIQETDRIDVKLDGVITRQDKMNHSVAENVKAIAINNKTTDRISRISKNMKWYILGLFGFSYCVAWIYDKIDIIQVFLMIVKKV